MIAANNHPLPSKHAAYHRLPYLGSAYARPALSERNSNITLSNASPCVGRKTLKTSLKMGDHHAL